MWTNNDAVALRAFLAKNPGFIRELESRIPKIILEGTIEQAAMTGASHAGATVIINLIKEELPSDNRDAQATPFIDPSQD